jgi:hypothetical protein
MDVCKCLTRGAGHAPSLRCNVRYNQPRLVIVCPGGHREPGGLDARAALRGPKEVSVTVIMMDYHLSIAQSKHEAALDALRKDASENADQYLKIDPQTIVEADHLLTALEIWGWDCGLDAAGNIADLYPWFGPELSSDLSLTGGGLDLLRVLTPYLDAGSYLQCMDDNSYNIWRHCWGNGQMHKHNARLIFDQCHYGDLTCATCGHMRASDSK